MEQMIFSICGVNLQISTDRTLRTDTFGQLFISDGAPDFRLDFTVGAPVLPTGADTLREDPEEVVYRNGSEICRACRASPGKPPFSLLRYNLQAPQTAQLRIPEQEWYWAAGPNWLWHNMALPQLLPHFGALVLHGSFIKVGGKAIIFTAPSGTGKSTQAALWEKHRGAVICNGDKTGLRVKDGVLRAYGLPFCGTSGICCNTSLPAAAIVHLSQAPENTVARLSTIQAIQSVMQNVYADRCVPEEWQQVMNLVLDVVSAVPVYHLACTPDERAVAALEQALADC